MNSVQKIASNSTLQGLEDLEGFAAYNAKALLALVADSSIISLMYPEQTSRSKKDDANPLFEQFEETGLDLMVIYPNPAKDGITVNFELPEESIKANIQVYNVDGRLVDSINLNGESSSIVLSVSKYSSGLYIYLLSADGNLIARKKLSVTK